jgi:hypothetical protein
MANDRFYIRCTVCGDYLFLGKYYPSGDTIVNDYWQEPLMTFIGSHLSNCQPQGMSFDPPMCLVFDNEETLCAAGGLIGGSGNVNVDRAERPG